MPPDPDFMYALFLKNQAELPPEDRVPLGEDTKTCDATKDGWVCTKAPHTEGSHIAHGRLGTVISRWA